MSCALSKNWSQPFMTSRRIRRVERRQKLAIAETAAICCANRSLELAAGALEATRRVVADSHVINILISQGIDAIPNCLAQKQGAPVEVNVRDLKAAKLSLDRISLEFTVAWRFFYPLLRNSEMICYLDSAWPGFVLQLKDAFIALVIDGPFPQALSGYRGRRHQG